MQQPVNTYDSGFSMISEHNARRQDTGNEHVQKAIKILREYYEGRPLFYASQFTGPKVFKPVLLYHTYKDQSRLVSETNLQQEHAQKAPGNTTRSSLVHVRENSTKDEHLKEGFRDSHISVLEIPTVKELLVSEVTTVGNCSYRMNNDIRRQTENSQTSGDMKSPERANESAFGSGPENIECLKSAFRRPDKSFRPYKQTIINSGSNTENFSTMTTLGSFMWDRSAPYMGYSGGLRNGPYSSGSPGGNLSSYLSLSVNSQIYSSALSSLKWTAFELLGKENNTAHSQVVLDANCGKSLDHNPATFSRLPYNMYHDSAGCYEDPEQKRWESQTRQYQVLPASSTIPSPPMQKANANADTDTNKSACHFSCHLCDTVCSGPTKLKNHLKVHLSEKPYKCECGRAFLRKEELTRHKRIHTDFKPFPCPRCGKAFGRKDHLNKHCTTHLQTSEKKVHKCEMPGCLQSYTRSDALARHQWSAHRIKAKLSKWRPHR